jgi:hypothetical protein
MDQPLQSALANVFSSPRLEAVHLRGLVLQSPCHLLSLFSEATALKEMSLSHLHFTEEPDRHEPWPESQLWRPKLRFLLLNASSFDLCRYLVNPQIDLTQVRTLRLAAPSPEQRKKMVLATSLRHSRGVEHLGLYLGYTFESTSCEYSPTYTASTINQISVVSPDLFTTNLRSIHFFSFLIVKLLGVFVKTCPHDSRLEYVTLECPADFQRTIPVPELHTAIDATVAHLPALKTIEIRWIFGQPSAALTQWEADMHASFSSLMRRGILLITKFQRMCTEFLVLEPLLIDVSS